MTKIKNYIAFKLKMFNFFYIMIGLYINIWIFLDLDESNFSEKTKEKYKDLFKIIFGLNIVFIVFRIFVFILVFFFIKKYNEVIGKINNIEIINIFIVFNFCF
jgi:hypothetical protein